MPYLISVLTIVAGVVVLLLLLLRLAAPVRRLTVTLRSSRAAVTARTGVLVARIAQLRVELDHRRRRSPSDGSHPTTAA